MMSSANQAPFVSRLQRSLARQALGTATRRLLLESLEDRRLLATVAGLTAPGFIAINQARDYLVAQADSLGLDASALQGLPVDGAEIAVTLLNSGEVTNVYNTYEPGLQLASTMPVGPAEARLTELLIEHCCNYSRSSTKSRR